MGRNANAGLFTVVANVNPPSDVLHAPPGPGRLYLPLELCPINALAALITDEQIAQRGGAGQAPHMRRENAFGISGHGSSSRRASFSPHRRSVAYIVLDKRYRIQ